MSDVAILLPRNEDVREMYDRLSKLGNYEVRCKGGKDSPQQGQDTLDFSSSNPKIMTYHSAKGLQFETVFLPYVEDFTETTLTRKALYVAITRTYRNLYVMYSGCLPAVLNQVDTKLYKTSEDDADEVVDI